MNSKLIPAEHLKYALDVVTTLAATGAHSAIKYVSPTMVIRATRPIYGPKGKKRVGNGNFQCTLVIGTPNSRQLDHIKKLKKAKEAFPILGVQLKYPAGMKV